MITLLNDKSTQDTWEKYHKLFDKAWEELKAEGKTPSKIDGFTNLAQYLSYIEDLVAIDPTYLMLPIDETPFYIDANSRTIKVPPLFANCSGVQTDNYSEIITFTIDRYFDYKDLDKAKIAVQWINAAGQEGISMIVLKDLETYGADNKIRFGWPLTADMTTAAGDLKFAVRFFDEIEEEDNEGNKIRKISYLFNTMPASIPIKSTLNIDSNGENTIVNDKDDEIFKSFIKNSTNPSYEIPTPVKWDENPPAKGKINDNNTATIRARASTKNKNIIAYNWYKEDLNDSTQSKQITNNDSAYAINFEYEELKFANNDWPETKPTSLLTTVLWEKDEVLDVYTPFRGEWPSTEPENSLYLQYTKLTFKDVDEQIIGKYYVIGTNSIEEDDKVINSVESSSSHCYFRGPKQLKIIDDLKETILYKPAETNILTIKLEPTNDDSDKTYTIFKKIGEEEEESVQENISLSGDTISYIVPEDSYGTYQIEVKSLLNRLPESIRSKKCSIVSSPIAISGNPTITDLNGNDLGGKDDPNYENGVIYDSEDQETKCILNINQDEVAGPAVGKITYEWFVFKSDKPELGYQDVEPGIPGYGEILSTDVKGSSLQIRTSHISPDDEKVYTYKCIVSNTTTDQAPAATTEFYFTII